MPAQDRVRGDQEPQPLAPRFRYHGEQGREQCLWVPKTSSASGDQAIFVNQATDASVSSDAVLLKIDRFG